MVSIEKDITIHAPVADVFKWVKWGPNFVGVWPNLIRSVEFKQDKNGLGVHKTVYNMVGIEIESTSCEVESIQSKKIVSKSGSPTHSTITFKFEEISEGTIVTLSIDYEIPLIVLRGLAKKIISRIIEKNIDTLLVNMKREIETLYQDQP